MCFCPGCGIYEWTLPYRRNPNQTELDQENVFWGVHVLPFPVSNGRDAVSGTRVSA